MSRLISGCVALCFILIGVGSQFGAAPATQTTRPTTAKASSFQAFSDEVVALRRYTIDPPDYIKIVAPGITELNNQTRTVDATGHVTLNLIGSIYVAGMTPEKVSVALRDATKKYYNDPDIEIVVTAQSKFYYVFGPAVASPGKRAFTARDSLVGALAAAGFNDAGWPEQVHVSRPRKKGGIEGETVVVDFRRVWEREDLTQNYLLEEGDIVRVPAGQLIKIPAESEARRALSSPATTQPAAVRAGEAR